MWCRVDIIYLVLCWGRGVGVDLWVLYGRIMRLLVIWVLKLYFATLLVDLAYRCCVRVLLATFLM